VSSPSFAGQLQPTRAIPTRQPLDQLLVHGVQPVGCGCSLIALFLVIAVLYVPVVWSFR
jgi:hypothetical protein